MIEMEKELISVILPAYNAERFLKEAIDSILAQTYTNFELIILNDGSTDRTEEIILSYDDPRIRYVKNETNLKLIKTLNKGIELAKGKYIARMDADDVALPDRFAKEVQFLIDNPEIDVVSAFPYNMNMNGEILGKSSYFCVTRSLPCKYVSMFEPPICHPISMLRTETIKRFKYSDEPQNLHIEAYELWNRMFHNGAKGAMIPEYLLYYRDNANSVCHVHNSEQWEKQRVLLQNSLKSYLGIDLDDEVAMCIMKKCETTRLNNIDKTFRLLDESFRKFCMVEEHLSKDDIAELLKWTRQRKLAILLTSILSSKGIFRFGVVSKLVKYLYLIFSQNNIAYIKNRLIRIKNE